jgi:hypothetical protein
MNKYLCSFVLCFSLYIFSGYNAAADIVADTVSAIPNQQQEVEKTQRNITYQEWNDLTNDDAFNYRDKIENQKIEQPKTNKFSKGLRSLFSSPITKVAIWGLLILVILYAVYKVIAGERSSIFGKSSKAQGGEEHAVIEDINETDWEKLLHKAAKEGDLRLSVRYSYMLLLRLLQDSGLILYREDKTNFQYISELAETQYKQSFRNLSRQYEYTWYGEYPISQSSYDEYIATIMDIKKKLGR